MFMYFSYEIARHLKNKFFELPISCNGVTNCKETLNNVMLEYIVEQLAYQIQGDSQRV